MRDAVLESNAPWVWIYLLPAKLASTRAASTAASPLVMGHRSRLALAMPNGKDKLRVL